MRASRYVGRVGGLAVALGVGVAIFTGPAVASAAPDADAGSPSTSTEPSTASNPLADPGPAVGTPVAPPEDDRKVAADPTDAAAPPSLGATPTTARGLVVATGGANTRVTPSGGQERSDRRSDDGATTSRVTKQQKAIELAATVDAREPEESATGGETVQIDAVTTTVDAIADVPDPGPDPDPASPVNDAGTALLAAAVRRETSSTVNDYADVTVRGGVITGVAHPAPPSYYTVVGKPINGGKVTFEDPGGTGTNGDFAFLPDATQVNATGFDQFTVLVSQKSPVVQFLEQSALLKPLVKFVVVRLQQIPIVGWLLSPIIGSARTYTFGIHVGDYLDDGPIAFTTKITSFDGTPISVNYFPKVDLGSDPDGVAPTILNGPSLATAGYTDPTQQTTVFGLVPGLGVLRQNYNVVTWDPRGEFDSGGRLHLDSEMFEARDVKEIIDWVSAQQGTQFEGLSDDPLIGMVGGSYGGGIQLTSAGIDPRIDAISPGIAWNNLTSTLYPNQAFKTSWASLLLLSLVVSGSRLDPEIYAGILTGAFLGVLTAGQQEFLSDNSPDTVTDDITIPTLFLQGTVDTLFPLRQAMVNAAQIVADGPVPMKMIWYCGGHGQCLDPVDIPQQTAYTVGQIMDWMDTYVMHKGTTPPADPEKFSWVDQDGNWWYSGELPTDADFYGAPYAVPGSTGGFLPIVPVLGGSGPQWQATFPVSLVSGAKVGLGALNLYVAPPDPNSTDPTFVVGVPKVTVTYAGLGTSRDVYAQLVDNTTGRVLGNIVSPIPVILDGRERTVSVDMEAIAYTMNPGDSLTLQIFDSATSFENFTSFGLVNVTSVSLSLPTAANVSELDMAAG